MYLEVKLKNLIKPCITKSDKDYNNNIVALYNRLSLVVIICATLVALFLLITAISYRDIIIDFLSFFEQADVIKVYLKTQYDSFSLENIASITAGLFLYFYFFEYIKKSNIYSFLDSTKESKYFQFLFSLFAFFNYTLVIFIVLYLIFVKKSYLETFVLVSLWIITKYIFIDLLLIYKNILFNYNSLIQFNSKQKYYTNLKIRKACQDIINDGGINFELKDFITKNKNQISDYTMKFIISFVFSRKNLLLKSVLFISIFTGILTIVFEFNILSIIYLQLHFILWYFVLSATFGVPTTLQNIHLINGENISNVYIVEKSPSGHTITLDSQNRTKKVMNSSILFIENKTN